MEAATVNRPPEPGKKKGAVESTAAWRLTDRIGLFFCWALGLLFCAIAAAIVIYFLVQGIKYVNLDLLTTPPKVGFNQNSTGGVLDPLLGTAIVAAMAMAIALPAGVAIAVWLSEFGRPAALARAAESTIEAIAGIPSIVLALFGTVIFSSAALGFLSRETTEGIVFGRSFFAASAMLALIALPLIVGSTREGLQSIPQHVREASYAVGKTKAATTRRILLPAARPQVATGAMLGLGRIIGDTAIILVLLGATANLNPSSDVPLLGTLQGTGSTLTSFVYANSPSGDLNQPEKAYAAAFVLLVIVLALNFGVDVIHRRARRTGTWST